MIVVGLPAPRVMFEPFLLISAPWQNTQLFSYVALPAAMLAVGVGAAVGVAAGVGAALGVGLGAGLGAAVGVAAGLGAAVGAAVGVCTGAGEGALRACCAASALVVSLSRSPTPHADRPISALNTSTEVPARLTVSRF